MENIDRRVDIYTPSSLPVREESGEGLPVLILIHGINGYEASWADKGGAIDTLETMLAQGRCQPMMLVMPDCNKWPFKERPVKHGNLWKCLVRYPRLSREHEIERAVSDLIDMLDTTYHTSRYSIAGLSDGARIAANVANIRPDRIGAVGLFSPVVHRDQLPDTTDVTLLDTRCYSVYVGKKDIFGANGKRYYRRLRKREEQVRYVEFPENHTWRMWRRCLSDFLEHTACE